MKYQMNISSGSSGTNKGFNGYFCPEPMTAMIDAPNLSMPAEMTGYREIKPQEAFEANSEILYCYLRR